MHKPPGAAPFVALRSTVVMAARAIFHVVCMPDVVGPVDSLWRTYTQYVMSAKATRLGGLDRSNGGADGTRTRDLRRDRPAF